MAREWRRAVFAALAAAMLGGACLLSVQARAANEEAEEEQEQTPAPDAQPKGGKKRQDPAEAQRAIEAALKQVQAGRTEQAVQAMTATLSGGNLPPAIMAKALYVRGLAHRQQRRSAQAISDLNGALWLKGGLGSEDRIEATKERSAAYADAGLGGRGEPEGPAPKTASGNWLSGLFGSPTPAAEPPAPARQPAPPPQAARVEPAAPARPPPVSSGWASKTEVQTDRSALAAAPPPKAAPAASPPRAAPAPAVPAPAASRIEGRYLIQLAAVRTEAEAQALVAKAKREVALASRRAAIDRAVLGNMGSFYRVRFGPFASAQETKAVCGKLQGSGFDCLPVAR